MDKEELERTLNTINPLEVNMTGHQELLKKNLVNIRKTPMLFALGLLILSMFMGGSLLLFFNPPSLMVSIFIPFCLLISTYGFAGIEAVVKAPFNLKLESSMKKFYLNVFKDARVYLIVSGWIGFMLGLILGAANLDDPDAIGPGLAVALTSVFYSYTLAYLYCYPIQRRLENNPDGI